MSARELITEHLDLWTGAVTKKSSSGRGSNGKVDLTGVKKLRELILELAVRGSLTEQRSDESDASEIVANLHKAQKQLVSAGLIKNPKPLKPLNESEKPYPLPKGWQWVRLGQTMEMYNGRAFKASEWSASGLPIVRIQNLNDPTAPTNYFSGPLNDRHAIDTGTFLISWSGTPGTSFGAFIWTRGPAALNQHINKCVFFGDYLSPKFMQLAVNGQMKNFIQSAQGGVGLKHVTKGVLVNALIALPPKEEQDRIVQKVDELMALCDRMEQQTSDQLEAHETLVDTLLGALTQSENAAELADNWARLAAHFDTLFTTEQSIDKLKQTILQLAVIGKLTQQDTSDEPVAITLNSLPKLPKPARYKSRSIEIIPGSCGLSVNDPKTQLPDGWAWIPLVQVAELESGHTPSRSRLDWWDGDIPWIGITDARDHNGGVIHETHQKTNEEGLKNSAARLLPAGTVCFSRTASVGYVVTMGRSMATSQDFVNWVPTAALTANWLKLVLMAERPTMNRFSKGAVHQTIYYSAWLSMHIALPPVNEQKRITQKVDELIALCDQLKERLNQASETRCHLAEAVVEGALN